MDKLLLVEPKPEHEKAATEYLAEFSAEPVIPGAAGLENFPNDYAGWLEKLAADSDYDNLKPGRVPASTFWIVREEDEKIIGIIDIRHYLNDFLLKQGGNIGYAIRPNERKKGYATQAVALGLEVCRNLNITKALVTCDKDNLASAKTIINNGGVLENEVTDSELAEVLQRYWISIE